jgi:hypothetical protein
MDRRRDRGHHLPRLLVGTNARGGKPAKLGHTTTSIDKFIQLAVAGEVVGLAAA